MYKSKFENLMIKDVMPIADVEKNVFSNLNDFASINRFLNYFKKIYDIEKAKLPYPINILDILWAKENVHSRIFSELLKQQNNNHFEILESFCNYLQNKIKPSFCVELDSPVITAEAGRIDLLVRDKKYAVIIENKIHGANDQKGQLANYFEKVRSYGYSENHIYIIYLTRDGNKEPDDNTWILNGKNYSEDLKPKLISLSYKNDILPWLKESVLPNCRKKDVYLKSTIEQYIDYLEGMFNQRKINEKMNQELQNQIKTELKFTTTSEDNYKKLTDALTNLSNIQDQINFILKETVKNLWSEWQVRLKYDFPEMENRVIADDHPGVGILMEHKGNQFVVRFEEEDFKYFGIKIQDKKNDDLKTFFKPLLEGEYQEAPLWYGWKTTRYENAYQELKALIIRVEEQIKLSCQLQGEEN